MTRKIFAGVLALILVLQLADSRYLPTRSMDDRLLRLRQLLKDLLENDLDGELDHQMVYEPRLYKREAYDKQLQYLH
ncbi:uncharacterized protein LOC106674362 [Cimex lectularius]|uniref:Proctolin n=1 Tax=Cimex lectularius TaxID=79782 RepID=A0A8I6SLN3_CIMLE|nr:uncharacterized protein LOC106674362 [Cimex lectularius]